MVTKITGIVINKQTFQDTDEIINIFCPEYGKLSFYALGTRKITSKNKYALQLFATSEFNLFLSKTNRLSKLKTGVLISNRLALANNYNDYLLAVLMLEILEQGWENNSLLAAPKIYLLITKVLDLFVFNSDNLWLANYFYFYSLRLFGMQWKLNYCVKCHSYQRIKTISFYYEGFLCASCLTDQDYVFDIEIIKMIYNWSNNDYYDFSLIETNFKTRMQAIIFLQMICEYYLNKVGIFSASIYQLQKNSIYFQSKIV